MRYPDRLIVHRKGTPGWQASSASIMRWARCPALCSHALFTSIAALPPYACLATLPRRGRRRRRAWRTRSSALRTRRRPRRSRWWPKRRVGWVLGVPHGQRAYRMASTCAGCDDDSTAPAGIGCLAQGRGACSAPTQPCPLSSRASGHGLCVPSPLKRPVLRNLRQSVPLSSLSPLPPAGAAQILPGSAAAQQDVEPAA